jgi:hypothetical protein
VKKLAALTIGAALLASVSQAQESNAPPVRKPPTKEQEEIIYVLRTKQKALSECTKLIEGKQGTVRKTLWPRYVKALQAIDTAGCPEDFRTDWTEYMDSCNKARTETIRGLEALWGLSHGSFPKDLPAESPAVAWQKLVHRAHVYHIHAADSPF